MAALVVLGVVAVGLAGLAAVRWRAGGDERSSVRQYQDTVETLRHLAGRQDRPDATPPVGGAPAPRGRPPRRPTGPVADQPDEPPPPPAGPARRAGARRPAPDAPALVFDDTAAPPPVEPQRRLPPPSPRLTPHGAHRRTRPTLPARWVAAGAAAVVVVAVVAVVVVSSGPNQVHHRPPAPATSPRQAQPTTTLAPAPLQPAQATSSRAVYATPATYTLVLSATAPCWVDAVTPGGTTVWTGLLGAGETRPLQQSGPLQITLGAAGSVTVTMNGSPVVLPTGFRSPFLAVFQPA